MMKRLWVLAMLLSLALSLTSCSSKKRVTYAGTDYGYRFCQGTIGTFDVYIIPTKADNSLFELSIIPVDLDAPGDVVKIHVANQNLSYRQVQSEVVLNDGEEIYAGTLTENDLQQFTLVAITPWDGQSTFLESKSQKEAICQMPQPGEQGDE